MMESWFLWPLIQEIFPKKPSWNIFWPQRMWKYTEMIICHIREIILFVDTVSTKHCCKYLVLIQNTNQDSYLLQKPVLSHYFPRLICCFCCLHLPLLYWILSSMHRLSLCGLLLRITEPNHVPVGNEEESHKNQHFLLEFHTILP